MANKTQIFFCNLFALLIKRCIFADDVNAHRKVKLTSFNSNCIINE